MTSFLIPFFTILIAEFLDKSQLTILLLATRTKHHLQLLGGVLCGFAIVDGFAIITGSWLMTLIPPLIIKLLASTAFIIFGILALRSEVEEATIKKPSRNIFFSGLTLTFLAEWGDKTQLAAGLFALKYQPFFVFLGVMCALSILSMLAIFLSKLITTRFERTRISQLAGMTFILLGLIFLIF